MYIVFTAERVEDYWEKIPVVEYITKYKDNVDKYILSCYNDKEDYLLVEVTNDDVWDLERSDKVSTFAECIIRITKKDLREYFIATDQADQMRFNSIALYTGRYVETTDRTGAVTSADYEDVRLFSKVNIPMEPMKLEKDFYAIYRVYGR